MSTDWCKWITCLGIVVTIVLAVLILNKLDKRGEGYSNALNDTNPSYCKNCSFTCPDGYQWCAGYGCIETGGNCSGFID